LPVTTPDAQKLTGLVQFSLTRTVASLPSIRLHWSAPATMAAGEHTAANMDSSSILRRRIGALLCGRERPQGYERDARLPSNEG
jgi:hypothetical protein